MEFNPCEWKSADCPVFMRPLWGRTFTRVRRVARVKQWIDLAKFVRQVVVEGGGQLGTGVVVHAHFCACLLILDFLSPGVANLVTL